MADPDKPGGGWLGLTGAGILMVACCALIPVLVAAGGLAAVGAWLRSPVVIGAAVALGVLALVAVLHRAKRR